MYTVVGTPAPMNAVANVSLASSTMHIVKPYSSSSKTIFVAQSSSNESVDNKNCQRIAWQSIDFYCLYIKHFDIQITQDENEGLDNGILTNDRFTHYTVFYKKNRFIFLHQWKQEWILHNHVWFTYLIAWGRHNCDTSQSRQFNFSFHAKINHIEFGNNFLVKPMIM